MKRIIALIVMVFTLALGAQAQAKYVLDFSGFLGGSNLGSMESMNFYGSRTIKQYFGADNVLSVGDPFIQTGTSLGSTGFFDGIVLTMPLPFGQMLTLSAPLLNGKLTAPGPNPGQFYYKYDIPAAPVNLFYSNPSVASTLIASFDLLAPSGGINDNGFAQGFDQGDFLLLGKALSMVSGVFFDENSHDLSAAPFNTFTFGELEGHITLFGQTLGVDAGGGFVTARNTINGEMKIHATPEPASMLLLGSGILGAAFMRRRNRRNKA